MSREREDCTENHDVISTRRLQLRSTIKPAERIREMRRMRIRAPVPIDVEFLVQSTSKVAGEFHLLMRQDVNGKFTACFECFDAGTRFRDAPQKHRWIQRYRGQRVCSQAHRLPIRAHCRYHRDSCSESTKGVAQLALGKAGSHRAAPLRCKYKGGSPPP
jgi:hypothetical protein